MKAATFYLFLTLFIAGSCLVTGSCSRKEHPKSYSPGSRLLERAYKTFRETSISRRRFKHEDILPLIRKHQEGGAFAVKELGKSVQQRDIYQLTYGKGKTKVMLWSQMHGDESTATMALFDLFNFLEATGDEFDTLRTLLAENTTLYFIPMLNPDGAEKFTRRNSYGFDINRDAVRAQSPEARILKEARARESPDFGFNLHDQSIYYNVSGTSNPATISVLAPAFEPGGGMNEVRRRSMQVIVGMNGLLQKYIPGGVGKYDDTFEPRAFGDNFQKWGTSTILIESGGYKGDPEKQFIRKLNFMVILHALTEIASGSYRQYEVEQYFDIPDNDNRLNDLVIRNLSVEREGQRYLTDVSIRRDSSSAAITDLGDLSVMYGYEELDASGYTWQKGKLYENSYSSAGKVDREEALSLLKRGYLAIRVRTLEKMKEDDQQQAGNAKQESDLPLILVHEEDYSPGRLRIGDAGSFFVSKEGQPVYAVIRGELVRL